MARLDVQAAVRWASLLADEVVDGKPTFRHVEMLLALSVTDMDGVPVDQLTAEQVRVGYQMQSEAPDDTFASISDFHHNGPTFFGTGWYSCIVNPQEATGWLQDQVFLCVTVQRPGASGHDRGRALLLASYHQIPRGSPPVHVPQAPDHPHPA
jgi:hypothetical protein